MNRSEDGPPVDYDAISRRWRELAPILDNLMKQAGEAELFQIHAGSSLDGDNKATGNFSVSTPVQLCLATAVEHLHALKVLIVEAEQIHPTVPFTLARAAVETGAIAYWVLSPRNRNERIARTLQWYSQDARDNNRFALNSDPDRLDRRLARIRAVAEARDLDTKRASGGFSMTSILTDIDREAALNVKPMWQLCSGFTHGRLWSRVGALDRVDVGPASHGARKYSFTISPSKVLVPTETALGLLTLTSQLWDRRASNPLSLDGPS